MYKKRAEFETESEVEDTISLHYVTFLLQIALFLSTENISLTFALMTERIVFLNHIMLYTMSVQMRMIPRKYVGVIH